MSTLPYCAKQATAMAEYQAHRAKAKLDDALDAEASREELIANRTQELVLKRIAEMTPIDIVAGLQSILEAGAEVMRPHILSGNNAVVGLMVASLVKLYIEQDSEVMAQDWMARIERELSAWEH